MPEPAIPTVLIVDDREENRYIVSRILRSANFNVIEVGTGRDALECARQMPDLIVLDIRLPDMSGFEVCKRIKANSATRSIPVLHLSASFVSSESKVMSLEGGADAYLTVPLEPTVLLATVRALLRLGRAESLSRLSAKQWEATFDSLSEGIGLLDLQGRIQRCNRAMAGLLGYNYSEIIDHPLSTVLSESLDLEFDLPAERTNRYSAEVECRGRFFTVSVDPAFDGDGALSGNIFVIADITDRKKAEEALRISERLAATGRLAHSIAHEINNPLEALTNILYLVDVTSKDDAVKSYLDLAQKELERVSRITKQTLAFHRESTVPVDVQLSEILQNVVNLYAPQMAARGICVEQQVRGGMLVAGFPGALQQVFANLIANAMEAVHSDGTIRIRISDAVDWKNLRRRGVRITIRDNGPGIPAETRAKIFDAFYTTKELKGSGLGLWLTLGIIHKHHGSISLRSRTHGACKGACFSVFLPAAAAEAPALRMQRQRAS